ncbi:MAG: SMI1/KNR4 family protein [Arcobacteraceae bacterium]|nr:SMI1/KNR4 family protein [Arcobacteraceae bacterium]
MYSEIKNLNIDSAKSVSDEQISTFEKELNISFGNEFKTYLKEFGCISKDYLEFYGICGENNSIPSAIFATKSMRNNVPNFSKDLIVFYEIGDGRFYCVDTNDNVYLCDFDKVTDTNTSFKSFLINKIKNI